METAGFDHLAEHIARELSFYSFTEMSVPEDIPGLPLIKVWRRETWNSDRVVVLVPYVKGAQSTGKVARGIKLELRKRIDWSSSRGFGLQIVMLGEDVLDQTEDLAHYVDKIVFTPFVLQSIFVVDAKQERYVSAITWGQYFTRRFQEAIRRALRSFLASGTGSDRSCPGTA